MFTTAFDSRLTGELRKILPVVLTLCAMGAAALQLTNLQPSVSSGQASLVLIAIFGAALVASIAGFAFSALGASVLIYVCPDPSEMVRILLVCSITVQLYCSARILRSVRWREVTPYLAGGLATAPLGIFLLRHVSTAQYAVALGLLLVAYALFALFKPPQLDVGRRAPLDICVGALGGITGGLAAFPGALPVIWCSARGLPKEEQRAICQPYILVMQIAALAWLQYAYDARAQGLLELWPFVPVALLGAYLGFSIFQRISTDQFRMVVLGLLVISGASLVATTW